MQNAIFLLWAKAEIFGYRSNQKWFHNTVQIVATNYFSPLSEASKRSSTLYWITVQVEWTSWKACMHFVVVIAFLFDDLNECSRLDCPSEFGISSWLKKILIRTFLLISNVTFLTDYIQFNQYEFNLGSSKNIQLLKINKRMLHHWRWLRRWKNGTWKRQQLLRNWSHC